MMRYLSPFLLILISFVSCIRQSNDASIQTQAELPLSALSGAYEALNQFAKQRIYPGSELPRNAHYAAWEQTQEQFQSRNGEPTPAWKSMGPHNFAGRMLALAFNPQNSKTLYAGSASGGLWRSYTAGVGAQAWEYVETQFPVLGVSSITFAPNDSMTMYIGTGEVYNSQAAGTGAVYRSTRGSYGIGILKSIDGGRSWSKSLDWSYDQNRGVWAIRVHPTQSNIIYAATTHGVYKSIDAGSNWEQMLDVALATDLLIHPTRPEELVVSCGNFNSSGKGIYKTVNGGADWTKIQSNVPATFRGKIQLALAPSDPDIIYATIGDGFAAISGNSSWLCRSSNFGSDWDIQNEEDFAQWQGWFSHDVAVNPIDPSEAIVIGISVWKTTNSGQTLIQKSRNSGSQSNPPIEGPDGNPTYTHSDSHDVIYHPDDPTIFYVANDGGIHRSIDGGETYESCNGGLQTVQFYNGLSIAKQDSNICLGGLQDNGTIIWNGDFSWRRINGGDGGWTAIDPIFRNTIYYSTQYLSIFRSFDRGDISEDEVSPSRTQPTAFIAPFVVDRFDGRQIIAGSAILHKSINKGNSWTSMNNNSPLDGNPVFCLDLSPQNKDVVYAATAPYDNKRSGVFVSTDGNQFRKITGTLPDRYPMDLAIDPTDEATVYITFSGYGTGHVFKSNDYGENWEDISIGLPDIPTNAVIVDPLFPSNIYVGNDLGVYFSIDGGYNWHIYQKGLPTGTMVFDLKISPSNRKLRIATHGNGVYQRDLVDDNAVSTNNPDLANGLQLEIWPNPAQGPVELRYELSKKGKISIDLFDSQGRQLRTLERAERSAGAYQLQLETKELVAGVYFIRLEMAYGVLTKQLIIRG